MSRIDVFACSVYRTPEFLYNLQIKTLSLLLLLLLLIIIIIIIIIMMIIIIIITFCCQIFCQFLCKLFRKLFDTNQERYLHAFCAFTRKKMLTNSCELHNNSWQTGCSLLTNQMLRSLREI